MDQKRLEYIKGLCMMDDLLMSAVLQNKDCARLVLRIILEDPGLEVQEVQTQETVSSLYGRAIRMDVKAVASDKRLCNIEVQRSDAGAVPKRARYNGSLLDANTALPGDAYGKLPEQYVILITANDVLKGGLPIYHIERVILETGKLFGDGSHIIYVNGKNQDDTPLGRLMQDFWCKDPQKMHYPELAAENRRLKETEEGAKQMESVVDRIFVEGREEGREEGRMEGRILKLIDSVCKKIIKGKSTSVIADELEEEESTIQDIVSVASSYVPEYDVEKIYAVMNQVTGKSAAVK